MGITLTGATGRIGRSLVEALQTRGEHVTVLTRNPDKARQTLGADVEAHRWDAKGEPAPAAALIGRDAVLHLAGEDVGQRWTAQVKEEIEQSRELGTRNLVAGIAALDPSERPKALVSASASGYYGPRGGEAVDESEPAGEDWLSQVVVVWEREADAAAALGLRVVKLRTGIVLDKDGGALAKMLLPFKTGVGGPIAGGRQYMPWIHRDDVVGLYLEAMSNAAYEGAINTSAPNPVTNKDFSKALGNALHRPAIAPVPKPAIQLLFGEMSQVVTTGVNMVPRRAADLGYRFRHTEIDEALRATLAG